MQQLGNQGPSQECACSKSCMGVQMGCPQQHASTISGLQKTLARGASYTIIRCLHLLTARALDRYFELRVKQVEQHASEVEIDPRLTAIVERMLDKYVRRGGEGPRWWEVHAALIGKWLWFVLMHVGSLPGSW